MGLRKLTYKVNRPPINQIEYMSRFHSSKNDNNKSISAVIILLKQALL